MGIIRQSGWDLVHNRRKLRSDIMRRCHWLRLEDSEYYQDCVNYYSTLDVRGRFVLDIGADFGTTPLYFIRQGAEFVWGFSLDRQYFRHERYAHVIGTDYYPGDNYKLSLFPLNETDNMILSNVEGLPEIPHSAIVLKCDAEGWEWNLSAGFIDSFHDWIIALHYPVLNPFLYEWIRENGVKITDMPTNEFAIYRKKKVTE